MSQCVSLAHWSLSHILCRNFIKISPGSAAPLIYLIRAFMCLTFLQCCSHRLDSKQAGFWRLSFNNSFQMSYSTPAGDTTSGQLNQWKCLYFQRSHMTQVEGFLGTFCCDELMNQTLICGAESQTIWHPLTRCSLIPDPSRFPFFGKWWRYFSQHNPPEEWNRNQCLLSVLWGRF